ncbi:MAG: hypothetical protein HY922_14170 [Elusimicrobia bacterium]|nr:hypothetical protein [Elusimicrobiota bacterium]
MSSVSFWVALPSAVVGWVIGCFLTARLSGWAALAKRYRAEKTAAPAEQRMLRSARMGSFARYTNSLCFAADPSGLRLSAARFFRPGHPPLFFPWSEVAVDRTQRSYQEYVRLRFRKVPEVPLLIYSELAGWLARLAGPAWPSISGQGPQEYRK